MNRTCLVTLIALLIFIPRISVTGSSSLNTSASTAETLSLGIPKWWNPDWRYRMRITANNPTHKNLTNEILFVYLDIPYGRCLSGFRELRVIDERGGEVPSAVVYERFQDGFTRGVFLISFANFRAMERRTLQVYYGNPTATPPGYRAPRPTNPIDGVLEIGFKDDTYMDLSYRKLYYYGYTSKVRYNGSIYHDYGSLGVAYNPLTLVEGWVSFNPTGVWVDGPSSIYRAIYRAGTLTVVRLLLTRGDRLWIFDALINETPNLVDDIVYIDLFDATALSTRGLVSGGFNLDDKVLSVEVGGTFTGFKSDLNPDAYDVDFWSTIYNRTRDVKLGMASEGHGDLALALQWNLGTLEQYEYKTLTRFLTVAANYTELRDSLNDMAVRTRINVSLEEEALESPIPSAAVMAINEVQMANLTVPLNGLTASNDLNSAGWIVNSAWIDGNVTYRLPGSGYYDFEQPKLWRVSRNARSGCIAFSTAHEWLEERKSHIGSVRLWDDNPNDYAWGMVTSRFIRVVGASQVFFSFQYKARYRNHNGTLPKLYVALVVDADFDEVGERILTLPLRGTFMSSNDTKVLELTEDIQWHPVRVDVTSLVSAKNFQFSIKVYAETYGYDGSGEAFMGQLEIYIDDVFVEVYGKGQDVFDIKLDPFSYDVKLTYGHLGLNTPFLSSVADVTVHYLVVKSIQKVSVSSPGVVEVVFPVEEERTLTFTEHSVLLYGIREAFLNAVHLNDLVLEKDHYDLRGTCLIINREPFTRVFGADKLNAIRLRLSNMYHTLVVHVRDANGRPLSNASVVADDDFGREVIENVTDFDGAVALNLIPSIYAISAAYHGIKLDSRRIELRENSELTLLPEVYELRFRVFNLLDQLVEGAEVRLMKDGVVIAKGLTNGDGDVAFKLVAEAMYTIEVFIGGELYLQSWFRPSVNNVTVDLKTSFSPMWFEGAIIGSLIIGPVVVLLFPRLFARKLRPFARKLRPSFRTEVSKEQKK